MPNTRKIF